MLGILALQGLRWVEGQLRQESRVRLAIVVADQGIGESALRRQLTEAGLSIASNQVTVNRAEGCREWVFELHQSRLPCDSAMPPVIAALAGEAGVMKLHWEAMR